MIEDSKTILIGVVLLAVFTVMFIIFSAYSAKTGTEAAGVIIVDPQHKVIVYDTENGRSWQAFEHKGTLVLIPGTEVQE